MPALHPFRAVRPVRDKAHLVSSRSYVTYAPGALDDKLAGNPYSFLHILRPEMDASFRELPLEERFERIRDEYRRFVEEGILVRDDVPGVYYYRQSHSGQCYEGFVGSVSTRAYANGAIRKHEQTLERREALFAQYLDVTRFNAEPVLLVHDDHADLEEVAQNVTQVRPEYEFTTTDKVLHELWLIQDAAQLRTIEQAYASMDALYIADGHHRCASSARLSDTLGGGPDASWHGMMAMCVPASHMQIFPFHRLVKDLGEYTPASFVEALAEQGSVEQIACCDVQPGNIHLFVGEHWYRLSWPDSAELSATQRLDSSRLNRKVLAPLLGITDMRNDKRVRFLGGKDKLEELEEQVRSGTCAAAFALSAVDFEALKAVADEGGTMPPKSTFVEPKLRSGVTIFELEA